MNKTINELIEEAHATAVSKGWWEGQDERKFSEQIALMHSELSEALEEWRKWGLVETQTTEDGDVIQPGTLYFITPKSGLTVAEQSDAGDCKPEGIAAEFADVLIRIFDTCGRYGIPLEEALKVKMAFNKTRPHRHGGKLA